MYLFIICLFACYNTANCHLIQFFIAKRLSYVAALRLERLEEKNNFDLCSDKAVCETLHRPFPITRGSNFLE